MMNAKQLAATLDDMMKETKRGNLNWKMMIETTDDLDVSLKEKVTIDDTEWIVDECFVEYQCTYRKQDFCMISYEHVLTCGNRTQMTCMIYLPPLGMRYFDIDKLAPYAIVADAYVSNRVHQLWDMLMALYRTDSSRMQLRVIDPLNN